MDDTNSYYDLAERLEDAFPEIDSDIVVDLQNNSEEYQQVEDEISALKQAHPFINGKMGAVVGSHDDTVMATALAIIAMREKVYYA